MGPLSRPRKTDEETRLWGRAPTPTITTSSQPWPRPRIILRTRRPRRPRRRWRGTTPPPAGDHSNRNSGHRRRRERRDPGKSCGRWTIGLRAVADEAAAGRSLTSASPDLTLIYYVAVDDESERASMQRISRVDPLVSDSNLVYLWRHSVEYGRLSNWESRLLFGRDTIR